MVLNQHCFSQSLRKQKELTWENKSASYKIDFQQHKEIPDTSHYVIFLWIIISDALQRQKGMQCMRRNLLVVSWFPFSLNHLFDQLTASADLLSIQHNSPQKLLRTPRHHCVPPSTSETPRTQQTGLGSSGLWSPLPPQHVFNIWSLMYHLQLLSMNVFTRRP